ncbi:MAG: quinone oxidoreductase [Nitriliruptoraceae bacterium]
MRAVQYSTNGGSDVLELVDKDVPTPAEGEVRVTVAAAGVNFIDTYQRSGLYPMALPSPIGIEGAGVISAVGTSVNGFAVGDRVAWASGLGSYAEEVIVAANNLVPVPDALDLESAASLMVQGVTAHYLATSTFPLNDTHTAVVYAAAGGVGRLLVQLAKERGARVLACTSTEAKAAEVRRLGADEIILYRDVDIAATVRSLTGGAGADVVYDSVGKTTYEASLASLTMRGMLVLYGNASGPVPPIDPQTLNKSGGLFLTRPSLAHYTRTSEELRMRTDELFAKAADGRLSLLVHKTYGLDKAKQAHDDIESGTTSGKLLIVP